MTSTNDIRIGPVAYAESEQFQRERRILFAKSWLLFAASAQMPAPGDFVSHSIGGWPLFAIRGGDGAARAFHNLCRHQSMPVVEQPTGSCEALRCRYHGWTYGLDGAFLEAPPRVAPAAPPAQLGLNPVELRESNGFCVVRVNNGDSPEPPRLGNPGLHFATAITTDTDANWKAVIEPLLGHDGWRLVWPLAFVSEPLLDRTIVRQIVPRSFLRTRVIDLIFTPGGDVTEEVVAAQRQRAVHDKIASESCHAARVSGTASSSEAAAKFLQELARACAE